MFLLLLFVPDHSVFVWISHLVLVIQNKQRNCEFVWATHTYYDSTKRWRQIVRIIFAIHTYKYWRTEKYFEAGSLVIHVVQRKMLPTLVPASRIVNVSVFMMQWPLTAVCRKGQALVPRRHATALHATCYKIYGTRVCATRGTLPPYPVYPTSHTPYALALPFAFPFHTRFPFPFPFPFPEHMWAASALFFKSFPSFFYVYFIISFWRPPKTFCWMPQFYELISVIFVVLPGHTL